LLAIRTGHYRLLLIENRRGSRLAIDEEVVPISTPTSETNFALSGLARQAGSGRLVWRDLVVTTKSGRVELSVSPHLQFRQRISDVAEGQREWVDGLRRAREALQPLYDYVKEQSSA
jgi:hypothetical protein